MTQFQLTLKITPVTAIHSALFNMNILATYSSHYLGIFSVTLTF